jgi:hypothetical protein
MQGRASAFKCNWISEGMAHNEVGKHGQRFVVEGLRVSEEQARVCIAAGHVACAVPQLLGGGAGASVSCFVCMSGTIGRVYSSGMLMSCTW